MNVPDEFDAAAAKVAGQTTNADPIDQAAARVVQGQRTALRSSLYGALLENPDVAARAQKLGRKTGLPADVVGRNLPEVERNAKLNEFDQLLQNSPVVAQWLADQNNAKVAHDDVGNMSEHERLFREALAAGRVAQGRIGETYVRPTDNMRELDRSIVQAFTEPVQRGLAGARGGLNLLFNELGIFKGLQSQRDAARMAAGLAPETPAISAAENLRLTERSEGRFPIPENVSQGMNEISSAQTFGEAFGAAVRNPRAILETTLQSIGSSAPALLMSLTGSVMGPGGTATGAGLGSFAVEYSNTLRETLREKGVDMSNTLSISNALNNPELMTEAREKAVKRGLPIAAFDALTAGLAGRLLAGAKPTVSSVVTRSAGELGLQAGGGAAGEAVAQAATGEYKPGDILMEALAELPSAIVEVPSNYRDSMIRAKSAEQRAQVVEQLNKLAAASKVRERDVDTFEQFIAQAAENGPVQHVYIDANTLMQSGMAEQLAQVSPSVAAQLQTAIATGGEIQIPVAEYTARIAGSEFAQSLVDDIRVEGEPFTRREAQEYMQNYAGELQAEFERVLAEKQNDETFKASAEWVKSEIKSQLDTVARFAPQVNEANASLVANFYAVMGAKLGATPEEVFAKYPLRVQAEAVQSGPVLEQGGQVSDWADREIAPVGSWVKADYKLADSQPVYQVRDLNPSDLYLPELDEKGRLQPEKRKHLDSYTERAKAGEVPPSITVIEMEDGRLRVVDGHRRALAAMAAGKNIRALVSPLVDTPDGRKEATVENIKQLNQSAQSQPLPATIEIDGKQRPTTNSNGQPIAATEEGVKNFWKWFGDSKVVDADGRPLVVYHGTTADFDTFQENTRGVLFVSPSREWVSKFYTDESGATVSGANTMPVYVRAENPFDFENKKHVGALATSASLGRLAVDQIKSGSWSRLEDRTTLATIKKRFDGLYVSEDGNKNLAVFNPTQIKSAIGNSGEFDPANPNILMQSAYHGTPHRGIDKFSTIEIDGKQRPTTNSNGQPIAATEEGVRNFWKWFGDSKVVDAEGRPLVVYHGTASTDITEFRPRGGRNGEWQEALSRFKAAQVSNARVGYMAFRDGSFFSPKADYAGNYTREGQGVMYPVYVKAENPVFFNQVKKGDVTGVDAKKTPDALIMHTDGDVNEVAVIDPTQIKSAIGNSGEFDPANPNILMQSGSERDLMVTHNLTVANLLHADKMGGLAVPSLAITKKDTPLESFGEITLIGPPEMADPKGYAKTQVFGADIYSPRYPSVERELDSEAWAVFRKKFEPMADEMGIRLPDRDDVGRDGFEKLVTNIAVMGQFLRDQGVEPRIVMRKGYIDDARRARLEGFGLGPWMDKTSVFDMLDDPDFVKLAAEESASAYRESGDERMVAIADKMVNDPTASRNIARDLANRIVADAKQRAKPEADKYETQKALDEQIEGGNLKGKFEEYVKGQLTGMTKSERIPQGYTNSGNRKYIPHTLENVVKILKKELRGGENFNYGVGSVRAKFTPQFKSVAQIKKEKGRLISAEQFEAVKGEINKEFSNMADAMNIRSETLSAIMEDGATQGLERAAKTYGIDLTGGRAEQIAEFMDKLRNLPTAYFEAKILRDVSLSEFKAAVVPEGTDPKALDALRKAGITDIRTYSKNDEADRAAKIGEFQELFFQTRGANRGSFNPSTNTITLLKNADLSTFLHEAGHFFLEVQFDIASRLAGMRTDGASLSEGEQQIVDDADALLKWFGVESVSEWYSLDFEEKRGYHEKFARGFEAYLFEGKAPSIELNRIFQTFRGWLTQVYRNIVESARQALKAAGKGTSEREVVGKALDVQLSDEVRAVMDRMLATNEEIRLAEQARSMMPLFENYEDAKGKVAWGIDEFKAYQALGVEATAEAIQDVQARTLRDLAWTRNARGREIKRLQKQAAELRREVQIEARREIMSQPIYRAWQFLTGKLDVDRTSPQEDYNLFLKQFGLTERAVQADMLSVGVEPAPAGSPDMVERKASTVAGDGMFAKVAAKPGDVLARASGEGVKYPAGRWTNHSPNPNAKFVSNERGGVDLVATRPIAEGDEVFINYRQAARLQGMRPVGSGRSDTVDPTVDSLFTAIAKLGGLSKDEVVSQWGTDPKDKPASGVFGKPVWRREGGRSIDSMAEALGELGYLPLDENGKADIRDLEERFDSELRGSPVYSNRYDYGAQQEQRAGDGVNVEALGAGRFDLTEIKVMGLPTEVVDRIQSLKMTGKVGLHPDIVAERFGFTSGDELVRTLATTESPKTAIEGLTDARMLEQYGELATPEAIERAADRAIHNEIRARLIAIEANGLAKATGQRKILASAAREFARNMIARLKVRDIRPSQYAIAEARAAKAAAKASQSGDLVKAAAEKRNQLVNNYATRAAYDAQDEVERITSFFRDVVTRPDDRVGKTRDMDVVNAARAVLSNFGYAGKAKTALEYLEAVKEYDPATYDVLAASVRTAEEMATPDIRDLTVEQLRALHDEVQSLWHLAKRNRQMEVDGDLLDREDVAADINARMVEFGIPDTAPGESSAITPAEKRLLQIKGVRSILRRVESWVDQMDGSNKIGAFRRGVFNPVKLAADKYRAAKIDALRQFRDSFDSIAGTMKRSTIYAPELGYTFGKDEGGVALNEILHAILHTGNESNKRKLLLGRGWAEEVNGVVDTRRWDAFIARMVAEGKLQREHFDFAQSIWDLMETAKPLAQKAHRDAYGKYFAEVTAQEFTDPFGVVRRGGYVPAQVDSRIVQDNELRKLLEEGKEGMAYAFPATNKGFTNSRVEYNRPLLLDLRTLPQHIDKVLLFSYMEMPVRDVTKLLTMKNVRGPLNKIDPTAISGMLMPWLNRSARQQVTTPVPGDAGMSRFFTVLRNRTSMATMFANLSNTAQQITGFSLAAVKVKPRYLLSATAQWISGPKQMARTVAEQSTYMSNRMSSEVDAMLGEIEAVLLDPTLYQRGQEWAKRHTFFMQSAFDNVMGPIIWTGALNEALEQGYSDKDAAHIADSVVRQTQGSTLPEDVSRIETGPAWARIFMQFAGYFNMQANLLGTEFAKVAKEMGLRKGATRGLYIFVAGFYIPALVAEAIAQAFRGGPGDDDDDGEYLDDWLMATLVYGPMRNVTAFVPFAGQVVNSAVARFNGNPVDDRVSVAPVVGALEGVAGVPVDLYQASFDEIRAQRTVKDVATLISLTTGLPASVAAKPIGYLAGVASDKIDPTGEFDFARGLVTGVASPESRGR